MQYTNGVPAPPPPFPCRSSPAPAPRQPPSGPVVLRTPDKILPAVYLRLLCLLILRRRVWRMRLNGLQGRRCLWGSRALSPAPWQPGGEGIMQPGHTEDYPVTTWIFPF